MAKFATNYTFRTPLRTIEFKAGQETVDAEVIAVAHGAGVLKEEKADASDGPAKRSASSRTLNLKG